MKIGKTAYKKLVDYWSTPTRDELIGSKTDMRFVTVTNWVDRAAVIDHIRFYDGQWHVSLIYAHPKEANTLVIRRASAHPTFESARFNARILSNRALSDPRKSLATRGPIHQN